MKSKQIKITFLGQKNATKKKKNTRRGDCLSQLMLASERAMSAAEAASVSTAIASSSSSASPPKSQTLSLEIGGEFPRFSRFPKLWKKKKKKIKLAEMIKGSVLGNRNRTESVVNCDTEETCRSFH